MKKIACLTIITAALAAPAFAAGARDTARTTAPTGGVTFTIALSEDIKAVDPGVAWNYVTNQVVNQITEGLVTLDAGNNIVPDLARSWRQVDDVTYVYEIRDDVTFSDGTKMTMDDVLFSLERTKDPEGGTYFSDWYADATFAQTGPWQLTVTLEKPSAVFKYYPTTAAGRIISKAYYEKHRDDFGTAKGGILATGPFVYESWTSGQEIVLRKNANYWNAEKAAGNIVDTIVYKIIPEDTTRVIALQNGSVDFCVNLPNDMIDTLAADKTVALTSVDTYSLTYLAFNTQRPPMSDVNVRRAISHALNLPEFQRAIVKRNGVVGTILPFGPALYGADAPKWEAYIRESRVAYDYDLAKAREALAQSAYPNGFDCDVIISESSMASQRALFLQEALKPLGINVTIRKMSGDEQDTYQMGEVLDAEGRRDYDLLFGGWEADYPDLNGNIEIMLAESQAIGGYNAAGYVNPEVDALVAEQRSTVDPTARFAVQARIMDIVAADVPYIVFDYSMRHSALNRKYTGLAVTAAWLWVLPVVNVRAAR